MNWAKLLLHAVLFFVLVPGVLVSLPPGGSRYVVAAVHAVVFVLAAHFVLPLVLPRH